MNTPEFDLSELSIADILQCNADLLRLTRSCLSLESAATIIVRYLRDSFVDAAQVPVFSLARLFVTLPWRVVAPAVNMGALQIEPHIKCLTLLGTAGLLPEWNDRRLSSGHQAIPFVDAASIERIPMIATMFRQFGITFIEVLQPDRDDQADKIRNTFQVFHLNETRENPYIPSQDDFVRPYGIRSCLGLGGLLQQESLFALVLFSRVPISTETAALFKPLSVSIRTALLTLGKSFS